MSYSMLFLTWNWHYYPFTKKETAVDSHFRQAVTILSQNFISLFLSVCEMIWKGILWDKINGKCIYSILWNKLCKNQTERRYNGLSCLPRRKGTGIAFRRFSELQSFYEVLAYFLFSNTDGQWGKKPGAGPLLPAFPRTFWSGGSDRLPVQTH